MPTLRAFGLLSAAFAAGCQQPAHMGMPPGTAVQAPQRSGLVKTITLHAATSRHPALLISVPSDWTSTVGYGDDNRTVFLVGSGNSMELEFWGPSSNLSCHVPQCGLQKLRVGPHEAHVNFANDRRSVKAFVPIPPFDRANSDLGVQVSGQCAEIGCGTVMSVLQTLRVLGQADAKAHYPPS